MLRLSINRAVSGMKVALPVLHPEKPEHTLLKPGAVLDVETIRKLEELNVKLICIQYPPTAFLMRCVSPALISEQGRFAQRVGQCIDAVAQGLWAEFDFLHYLGGVRLLMQRIVEDPDAALFIEDIVDAGQPLVSHAFNVGMMSLLMGLRLDGYLIASRRRIHTRRAQNVENLGLGGLLHDLGMLKISAEALERWHTIADETDEGWREHVTLGYELVRGRVPPTAAAVVLHHHQRLDGSGFPRRQRGTGATTALAGREIHIFARIVAVADVFNRYRHPPVRGAKPQPTVRALRQTLEQARAGKLDPVVFRALLTVTPAFAPGTMVTLNDGETYVVTDWRGEHPCRPTVCAIEPDRLEDGSAVTRPKRKNDELGPPIDLRTRQDLWVVKAEGEDVAGDLFEPKTPFEFDLRTAYPGALVEPMEYEGPFSLPGDGERAKAG